MFDNLIVIKDADTIEVSSIADQDAQKTKNRLEHLTLEESKLGKEGLPTDYKINLQGTTIILQGKSVDSALCIVYKDGLLSGTKFTELGNQIASLKKAEILSRQAASRTTGIFAARAVGRLSTPRVTPNFKLSDEAKAILEKQKGYLAAKQAKVK